MTAYIGELAISASVVRSKKKIVAIHEITTVARKSGCFSSPIPSFTFIVNRLLLQVSILLAVYHCAQVPTTSGADLDYVLAVSARSSRDLPNHRSGACVHAR